MNRPPKGVLKPARSWHSLAYLPAHFPWQGPCPQKPTREVAIAPQERVEDASWCLLLCSTISCLPPTALLLCPAFVVEELDVGEQLQGEIKMISLLVHSQTSKCISRTVCSPPATLSEMWLVPKTVIY